METDERRLRFASLTRLGDQAPSPIPDRSSAVLHPKSQASTTTTSRLRPCPCPFGIQDREVEVSSVKKEFTRVVRKQQKFSTSYARAARGARRVQAAGKHTYLCICDGLPRPSRTSQNKNPALFYFILFSILRDRDLAICLPLPACLPCLPGRNPSGSHVSLLASMMPALLFASLRLVST